MTQETKAALCGAAFFAPAKALARLQVSRDYGPSGALYTRR